MGSYNNLTTGQQKPPGVNNMIRTEASQDTGSVQSCISSELKTLRTILHTLETNSDIVYTQNGMVEVRDKFREHIVNIEKMLFGMRDNLIALSLKVGDALRNYGVMAENSDIISASNIRELSLRHSSEKDIVARARNLFRNAMDNISTLCFFGISIETLNNLDNAINRFAYVSGVSVDSLFLKPAWQKEIDSQVDETFSYVFDTLDNYAEKIKDRHPQFYAEYTAAKVSLPESRIRHA